MKTDKIIKTIIIVSFIILFILASILFGILKKEKNTQKQKKLLENKQDLENSVYDNSATYSNMKSLLEDYGCVFVKEVKSPTEAIYLYFGKNLYNDDGTNNKDYFESLINACSKKLSVTRFYLYDSKKDIQIEINCDLEKGELSYKINNQSNYFDKLDGDLYVEVEKNTEIAKYQAIPSTYNILLKLVENNMFISSDFGNLEGRTADNRYNYYLNKTIKARVSAGRVRNIVFLSSFEENVLHDIKVGTDLNDIKNEYSDNAFGSIAEGMLGYRTKDLYLFIYEDEISAYGYSYYEHTKFETYLSEYIQNRNLELFANQVTSLWQSYEAYEYDKDNGKLYLAYPAIGVIINIENNNPMGIKLYSNYYFTATTKRYITEGKITLVSTEDALYNLEKERRANEID